MNFVRKFFQHQLWLGALFVNLMVFSGIFAEEVRPSYLPEPPPVAYDSGNTKPMTDFVKPIMMRTDVDTDLTREEVKALAKKQGLEFKPVAPALFPVKSKSLTLGKVHSRKATIEGLHTPTFILGYDKTSLLWLKKNLARLQQLKAYGVLTNVNNAKQLTHVRQLAKGLQVVPHPADIYAKTFQLKHYPVLLTDSGIMQ